MIFALVTGTTNGIGNSITKKLLSKKKKIIGIDKKINKTFKNKNFYSNKLNILDSKSVFNFLKKLKNKKKIPFCFILNAGINIYDNNNSFSLDNFKKCFNINFYGVMNFVNAIENLKIRNKKIICISSTSNIIPNPRALGYYSSKVLLKKNFELLNFNKTNEYKTIILGPVKTKISRNLQKPSGIAGIIYEILQISSDLAALKIISFISSSKKVLYVTYLSLIVYYFIKCILFFNPNFYMNNNSKKK
jgi:3-oxoacyl-[acyl-carrier protein] reductase